VAEGKFRGDLFARLNEYSTVLPPLRERKEDIFALTEVFTRLHAGRRLEPTTAFMMALLKYDWPFNVRELESTIKRAAALSTGGTLEVRDLPPHMVDGASVAPEGRDDSLSARSGRAPAGRRYEAVDQEGFARGAPTEQKMRELLTTHSGNIAAVARELGKGRMQIHRWVSRYRIDLSDYRRESKP
jgi:transcriptional regulator of acetoin/glycerol metabolism